MLKQVYYRGEIMKRMWTDKQQDEFDRNYEEVKKINLAEKVINQVITERAKNADNKRT